MFLRDSLRSWLRSLSRPRCVPIRRPADRRIGPALERLEVRWLPATNLTLNPVALTGPVSAGLYDGPVDTFTKTGRTGVQASDFHAVINWGDHSPVSAGTVQVQNDGSFEVLGSHVYHEGSYSPLVMVTDEVAGISSQARVEFWTGAAAMPIGVDLLGAATAPDGRIFAIGGLGATGTTNRVNVYDPASNTWSAAQPMPTSRYGLAAVAGPDGRIYAIGGIGGGRPLNTMEVYDPASNTWSTAAPMPTSRLTLAAAAGPDGRIYAIGGGDGQQRFNTVEVYDPASNTWSTAASLPTATASLTAVAGPDGRIYAIGGDTNSGSATSNVEVYDPAKNTWASAASMFTARRLFAAAPGPDGRIYALGGMTADGTVVNTVEAYDPASNNWSAAPPMATPLINFAAVEGRNGTIYAIGGENSKSLEDLNTVEALTFSPVHVLHGSLTSGAINLSLTEQTPFQGTVVGFQTSNTLEKASDFTAVIHWGDGKADSTGTISGALGQFTVTVSHVFALPGTYQLSVDITDSAGDHVTAGGTLQWRSAVALPAAQAFLAAATGVDGRIYALGGFDSQGLSTQVQAYDPTTNTWSTLAPLPTVRYSLAAVTTPDGRVFALGGFDNSGDSLNSVEVFDPRSNSWSTAAPLPEGLGGLAAAVGPDGRIYVFGGATETDFGNAVYVYDPERNIWSIDTAMPAAEYGMAAVTGTDGRIYVFGGYNGGNLNRVDFFDPASNSWSTAASLPTPATGLAGALDADGCIYALGGEDNNGALLKSVQAYDPISNTWSTAAAMLTGRYELAAATGADGRIYAIGGDGSSGAVSDVEVMNFGTSAQVASLPASHFVVTGFPSAVAGIPQTFTVTAEDAYGNTVSGYSGTVSFSASGVANLPAPAMLTNGTGTFTATLFSAGLQSLAASDGTLSGHENDIIVAPSSPQQLTIRAGNHQSATVNTNNAQPMDVILTDAFGNPVNDKSVIFAATASGAGGAFGGLSTVFVPTGHPRRGGGARLHGQLPGGQLCSDRERLRLRLADHVLVDQQSIRDDDKYDHALDRVPQQSRLRTTGQHHGSGHRQQSWLDSNSGRRFRRLHRQRPANRRGAAEQRYGHHSVNLHRRQPVPLGHLLLCHWSADGWYPLGVA
jgi:N-acetylneuraminic acid mutarotase